MCSLRVGLRVGCVYAWAAIRSQPATQPTFWQAAVGELGQHATHRCPKLANCIVRSRRFMLAIVFYTPWANIRLTSCFFGTLECMFVIIIHTH